METSNFRPESHVAQRSRRDKLRIPHSSTSIHRLDEYPNNLEHSSVHSGLDPDLVEVRNVRIANFLYDPVHIPPEIINFSTNSNVLSAQRHAILHQELGGDQTVRSIQAGDASLANVPRSVASDFNASSRATGDPQGCGNWKNIDLEQNVEWLVNYASGSSTSRGSNQSPMFVGDVLPNDVRVSNNGTSTHYMDHKYSGYQSIQSIKSTKPSSQISSLDDPKHYGDMHFASSSLHQNSLQDVVTIASVGSQRLDIPSLANHNVRENAYGSWTDDGNDLVLRPIYGNQSNASNIENYGDLMNRPVGNCRHWNGEMAFMSRKSNEELSNVATDANTRELSLSLSSDPRSKLHLAQFGGECESQDSPSRINAFKEPQDSMTMRPNCVYNSMPKPSVISKLCVGTSTYVEGNRGPLGPFTGYATILKSSRFLRPAQELLNEFCNSSGLKFDKTYDVPERISGEMNASASASADGVIAVDREVRAEINDNSGVLSSTNHSSNEISGDCGVRSSSSESYRPGYHQKKAKLLYLQEEVCRKYKQYHQQMQMVVSSFESVAGLSAATPYVSLALKTVSRNFRYLKNAISDQLMHLKKALGEDLLSPTSGGASCSKNNRNLSHMDKLFQKHKSCGGDVSILEPQQQIWRPQRGLPERSVAILKAWLFEHFLHPYPTDTDKHMLAAQAGLSRNQVSNWFINARVRVWKPMVEEIHMLETKGSAEVNRNTSKNEGKLTAEGTSRPNSRQPMNKLGINAMSETQLEYSGMDNLVGIGDGLGVDQWTHEKRSRVECQVPASMDRSVMGFVPYQRGGVEIGGLGAVSLTLGLRHGVESAHQQQQLKQQEDQLRRQFGGPMIHDFVG
ncbi:Homeobox_KN domain-containing protein/POX domain-containing protein [Cephalotus follicularis]|uniref:Homeobox_KN domain-containing protein/POX domain-containing protein n=1 Tax=Cephalotus follicularis TaxID=3775 RepID=A0A1Q3B3S4_CEPFO|nr:Homeobox_KN domain-containing protein/POX domain-containing protein [Cephalotus follicularis]